jgi:hypothetical protein
MMKRTAIRFLLFATLLLYTFTGSHAQVNPANAYSFLYPQPGTFNFPNSVGAYSIKWHLPNTGDVDVYVATMATHPQSGFPSSFIYTITASSDPTTILAQGDFPYPNVDEMDVTMCPGASQKLNVVVAYHQINGGHFIDIYEESGNIASPFALLSTTQVSSALAGRIRVDAFKDYVAAVWENLGTGIETVIARPALGMISTIKTLNGTSNCKEPDLAFLYKTNSNGDSALVLHYVYYDTTVINHDSLAIIESKIFVNPVLNDPAATVTPIIEDVNIDQLSTQLAEIRPVLDCPDNYDVDNWAYAYVGTWSNLSIRHMDYHSMSMPVTTRMTNLITSGTGESFYPCLHYHDIHLHAKEQLELGWHWFGGWNYLGVNVKEDGGGYFNASQMMLLPSANVPLNYSPANSDYSFPIYMFNYTLKEGIAYSKQSTGGLVPDYLYAVYYDYDRTTSTFYLHHAFHRWSDPLFRGPENGDAHGNQKDLQQTGVLASDLKSISAAPNPFRDYLKISFFSEQSGLAVVELQDISGRVVRKTEQGNQKGSQSIALSGMEEVPAGIYLVNLKVNNKQIGTAKVTKQ